MIDVTRIPSNPGCYLFRNNHQQIIYIGKAKNIRKRVKSYFQKKDQDPKTRSLITAMDSVEFFITDTEVEAFILENTLIKKHQPKYNINLKDAKTYAFIELTTEPYPRLLIARQTQGNGTYFGPFVSAVERDHVLQFLNRTFALRTCRKLPKKACLRYHLQLCSAPCIAAITPEEYNRRIRNIRLILSGKSSELLKKLCQEMTKKSQAGDYEAALILRNQITAIQHLQEHQKMQQRFTYDQAIINYQIKDGVVYLSKLTRSRMAMRVGFLIDAAIGADRNAGVEPHLRLPAGRVSGRRAYESAYGANARTEVTGVAQWFDYHMAECDRLTLAFAQAAAAHGAVLVNHAEATDALVKEGRLRGVRVADGLTGGACEVEARLTVNAAGAACRPWMSASARRRRFRC